MGPLDSKVYIFNKDRGKIIEILDGHGPGAVNAVAWNSREACMFASAGDDKKVRM